MRLLTLIACFLPSLIAAQDISTPSGPLRIIDTEVDGVPAQELWIGKQQVVLDTYAQLIWVEDQLGSLILVGLAMGGNACPAAYAWVHTDPGNVHASPSFGTCSDLAEVSHDSETVTVTLPDMDGSGNRTAFIYDGKALSEKSVGQAASDAPPGAGADLWIARYPFEILQAADWQPLLLGLMGQDGLAEAREMIGLASPMEAQGDWVVGQGCLKDVCDGAQGIIALHRRDGRVVVAVWAAGQAAKVWGDTTNPPPMLAEFLDR